VRPSERPIMKPFLLPVCLLFLTDSVWPQTPRRAVDTARIARLVERAGRVPVMRSRSAVSSNPQAEKLAQAPGVIQMNLLDASHVVWFVTADTLPRGTEISPFVVFPDGSEMPLEALRLDEDVPAGSSFDLPNIRKFSSFWPQGLLTYGVLVNTGGRNM